MTRLIDALPPHDVFSQSFHHSITNWQPLSWKGFTQTTRYTYILKDLSDLDKVMENFEKSKKGDMGRAREVYKSCRISRQANSMSTTAAPC
jgi:hypothetical protein